MRRVPASLLLTLALLGGAAACSDNNSGSPSREERGAPPEASEAPAEVARVDARLEGRVVTHEGRPVDGVAVRVSSQPTATEQVGGFFAFAFTAGLACIASDACFPSGSTFQTTTDAGGRYSVVLPRAHIPGYEADTDWRAGVTLSPSPGQSRGPSTVEEFEVAAAVQASPDLIAWTTPVTVDANRARVIVRWTPLDVSSFDGRRVEVSLGFLQDGRAPVWVVQAAAPGDVLDARVLEDAQGTVSLVAKGNATSGPTIYHRVVTAGQVPFSGTAGAPLSRGSACSVVGEPPSQGPCWLTDGDLTSRRERPVRYTAATVDLGRLLDLGLLVVRGCAGCAVELSTDGKAWEGVDRGRDANSPDVHAIELTSLRARFVRLSRDQGGVESTSEVSVWPPLPRLKPADDGLLPDSAADEGDAAAGGAPADDDNLKWVLAGMAFVLLLLSAGAAGWALSRRRER